jgi:hypothetical protein
MARVHDFDTDRTGVDVDFAGPHGFPRVPCTLFLRHALNDAAVFKYDVMGRNFAFSGGKTLQRRFTGLHPGVMQQDHVRRTAFALVKIR